MLGVSGVITVPTTPPIDPMTNGIRLVYRDRAGIVFDTLISGGAYDPATRPGWTAKGGSFKYVDQSGASHVSTVVLKASASVAGQYKVNVKGRNGSYAASSLPVQVGVILDPPNAVSGQCGEWRFPTLPPAAPSCMLNAIGSVMRCR